MTHDSQHVQRRPMLGCIADDVTGATDLAINLVQGGMRVVQLLEVPESADLAEIDADAVVVGLKTRSVAKQDAIQRSVAAFRAFRQFGIQRFFFKYCSTFDSTREGNIGPVAIALLDELNAGQTIFCPAFPRNGRTVYQGHLFVYDQLLNESGMEQHPLNPMTDANLVRFLGEQCDRKVGLLDIHHIEDGTIARRLVELEEQGISLVVVDACNDQHLQALASAVGNMSLVTGGSGIGRFLPAAYRDLGLLQTPAYLPAGPRVAGRTLIVAGSCSQATNEQVDWIRPKIPCWRVDVDAVIQDPAAELRKVAKWAMEIDGDRPALIYSTSRPEEVSEIQSKHGAGIAATAIEEFLAESARLLVAEHKISRLIVAGGETSGTITNKLGVRSLQIGQEICAGVPWTESNGPRSLALAFKSGNFGAPDFFEQAWKMLP